jgi:hypothetical protein
MDDSSDLAEGIGVVPAERIVAAISARLHGYVWQPGELACLAFVVSSASVFAGGLAAGILQATEAPGPGVAYTIATATLWSQPLVAALLVVATLVSFREVSMWADRIGSIERGEDDGNAGAIDQSEMVARLVRCRGLVTSALGLSALAAVAAVAGIASEIFESVTARAFSASSDVALAGSSLAVVALGVVAVKIATLAIRRSREALVFSA